MQETAYWLDGLFPGDLKFSRINGLHIASIDLSSEDTTEALACTADFGRVDTGLVSSEEAFEDRGVEKQVEVRSEIFCVASAEPEVVERAVVAAASVLAKVERDSLMAALPDPGYGWASNKGYAAPAHREAIATLGASEHHRRSWHLPGLDQYRQRLATGEN